MRNRKRDKFFELLIERLAICRFHERIRARNRRMAFGEVAHDVAVGNKADWGTAVIHDRHAAYFAIDQLMHDFPNRHGVLYDKGGLFHKQGYSRGLLGLYVLGGSVVPFYRGSAEDSGANCRHESQSGSEAYGNGKTLGNGGVFQCAGVQCGVFRRGHKSDVERRTCTRGDLRECRHKGNAEGVFTRRKRTQSSRLGRRERHANADEHQSRREKHRDNGVRRGERCHERKAHGNGRKAKGNEGPSSAFVHNSAAHQGRYRVAQYRNEHDHTSHECRYAACAFKIEREQNAHRER